MSKLINKVAVVINGDEEQGSLKNVDRALINVLIPAGYKTWVVSPQRPDVAIDHYFEGTPGGVETLLKQLKLKGRVGPDTEMVIYITGHGAHTGFCLKRDCQTEAFLKVLDGLSSGATRTVVMDQCYGGRFITLFADDPKTLFTSAGSRGETDRSGEIAPRLWAPKEEVPDRNGDGIISWEERFDYAVEGKTFDSTPQFAVSEGYPLKEGAHFPANVKEIIDKEELEESLGQLRPGQYAVIAFLEARCELCQAYKPDFERFAKEWNGRHLFLRTENTNFAEKWGMGSFPTVVIVNWRGERITVNNRNDISQEIAQFEIPLEDRLMAKIATAEKIDHYLSRANALREIAASLSAVRLKEEREIVFERLIDVTKKIDGDGKQADALREIAFSLCANGLKEEGITVFIKSIAEAEKIDHDEGRAYLLRKVASSLLAVGLNKEGIAVIGKSITAAENIMDKSRRAYVLRGIASTLSAAGLLEQVQLDGK